ncbi:restriction endonuclease [Halopseudomonas oceani]|uniref:restriction endonuclease n=1 Tax=Halopseudomonas oceani TaxID=1708783 RepID=UPI002AA8C6B2|nr:restriction endonuclease [Halopseudomonas oceani]
MARKRTSAVEDFIVVLSHLPWWTSLLIALVSWLILHPVATAPAPPAALKPGDMGGILTAQLWRTLAMFGHYLIPFCCLLGAIGSIAARRKRKHLFDSVKPATQPARTIDGLSWQQFEQLIGEAFRKQGYSITETGGNGPDGGVDLILRKHNEKYLVQCKHWRSLKVGVPVVREFFGAMAAEGRNIQLIDGAGLKRLMVRQNPTTPVAVPERRQAEPQPQAPAEPLSNRDGMQIDMPYRFIECTKCGRHAITAGVAGLAVTYCFKIFFQSIGLSMEW